MREIHIAASPSWYVAEGTLGLCVLPLKGDGADGIKSAFAVERGSEFDVAEKRRRSTCLDAQHQAESRMWRDGESNGNTFEYTVESSEGS
jgi:hypothetical protein